MISEKSRSPLITSSQPARIAIVSDIHANLVALESVVSDMESQGCCSALCLGDILGYGPEPAACVKKVREIAAVSLMGNHEAMYLATRLTREHRLLPKDLGTLWPAVELAHDQLDEEDVSWVSALPLVTSVGEISLVHASLQAPHEFDYITGESSVRAHFARQETWISFHGHTHVPAIWEEENGHPSGYVPPEGPVALRAECRYAIGVGSVGQPRDNDPRACYAIYDGDRGTVELRRVPYDIARARQRFASADLLGFHCRRLATGE